MCCFQPKKYIGGHNIVNGIGMRYVGIYSQVSKIVTGIENRDNVGILCYVSKSIVSLTSTKHCRTRESRTKDNNLPSAVGHWTQTAGTERKNRIFIYLNLLKCANRIFLNTLFTSSNPKI